MWHQFWEWAWLRHHNVLSWYIRPLFLIPYVWFGYRRSPWGLCLTVVALATSMFWFPAPPRVDPRVEQFLAAELAYVVAPWTIAKVLLTLTVPVFFATLAFAFWRRSWRWGVAVLTVGAGGKVMWSVMEAGSSGWAVAVPALVGLAACTAAVLLGVWSVRRRTRPTADGDG